MHGGYRLPSPFGHPPDTHFIGACVDDRRNILEVKAAGLLIGRGGLYGNVIRVAPPLTVTREEVDERVEILIKALEAAAAGAA